MLIRVEEPRDVQAIREVTVAAFRQADDDPDPVEADLVQWLRADEGWIPALSFVAERDGVVVGHVVATRGYVEQWPALGLGPLSVHPDHQGVGIGSALVHDLLGDAGRAGETLVALLGDPDYYERFGFREASWFGVHPPNEEWGRQFQALTLPAHDPAMAGRFRYAAPFDRV